METAKSPHGVDTAVHMHLSTASKHELLKVWAMSGSGFTPKSFRFRFTEKMNKQRSIAKQEVLLDGVQPDQKGGKQQLVEKPSKESSPKLSVSTLGSARVRVIVLYHSPSSVCSCHFSSSNKTAPHRSANPQLKGFISGLSDDSRITSEVQVCLQNLQFKEQPLTSAISETSFSSIRAVSEPDGPSDSLLLLKGLLVSDVCGGKAKATIRFILTTGVKELPVSWNALTLLNETQVLVTWESQGHFLTVP